MTKQMKLELSNFSLGLQQAGNGPGNGPIPFLQSRFWAKFKEEGGWKHSFAEASINSNEKFTLSILERKLAPGLSFAYVPHGPLPLCQEEKPVNFEFAASPLDEQALSEAMAGMAKALKPRLSKNCAFVRFDPPWFFAEKDGSKKLLNRPDFSKALYKGSDVQAPDTVVLDLRHSDEELLAGMKPKWRYNIRLAAKKGVIATETGKSGIEDFYTLYKETAARDKIGIHPKSYYEKLFELAESWSELDAPQLRLWAARHEGRVLAAIICVFYGETATYLYGASSDEHRNLMPAYALQWAAIRAAKEAGCLCYDFYGIPPTEDESHPMAGLYRFKTGFGGEIRHYAGAWDYPLKPLAYRFFRLAEKARLYYHKVIKKGKKPKPPV